MCLVAIKECRMTHDHWNPDRYARECGFVARNGESLIEWLAPRRGERVLDLGCGEGKLTAKLVEAGCDVVGVDASPQQIAAARAAGLNAIVADGAALPLTEAFDAVFSNAALHWMKRPDAVIASVFRSLRLGGRFVAEFGAAGNVATIRNAIHDELRLRKIDPWPLDPWYFPSEDEYRGKLEAAGFRVVRIEAFLRPTRLLSDVAGWLRVFAGPFTSALPPEDRESFLAAVQERARPTLQDSDGSWSLTDYRRLRFEALKVGEPSQCNDDRVPTREGA
jgi:SAM-dependent methyltransferase